MDALIAAGAAEVALGALIGFPYAVAVDDSPTSRRLLTALRVRHPRRLRQLHLDLIIMGVLLMAAGVAVPDLPTAVALAVGIGGWTNALLFVPLMVDERQQHRAWFRAVTVASFLAVSGGWVGVAAVAVAGV
ncbi:hypothetical protein [Nocardioides sp. TF02-7]|uniref:hypothetical protein n=1 Tax=Nocardioides sp. TF02-7 TaxID=2917724 RepID=UPI001F06D092|nr:hypothetical protein [Nocardioides sp. TF02-7]UMG94091.1 hypothetical protein MF408_08665 [Nocardioides sp. TF02-7]